VPNPVSPFSFFSIAHAADRNSTPSALHPASDTETLAGYIIITAKLTFWKRQCEHSGRQPILQMVVGPSGRLAVAGAVAGSGDIMGDRLAQPIHVAQCNVGLPERNGDAGLVEGVEDGDPQIRAGVAGLGQVERWGGSRRTNRPTPRSRPRPK
jgi:hypothetical protein